MLILGCKWQNDFFMEIKPELSPLFGRKPPVLFNKKNKGSFNRGASHIYLYNTKTLRNKQ